MGLEVSSESYGSPSRHLDAHAVATSTESHPATALAQTADQVGHWLLEESHSPTVHTVVATAVGLGLAAGAFKLGYRDWSDLNSVRTADSLRSLIQMSDYGGSDISAATMEKIIALGRQSVLRKTVTTGAELEQQIASGYLRKFYPALGYKIDRDYAIAGPRPKHLPYWGKFDRLLAESPNYTSTAEINGNSHQFIRSEKISVYDSEKDIETRLKWNFEAGQETQVAARGRINELFRDVLASRSQSPTVEGLQANLHRVAEMEWLNANLWKYARGSAGVSQLEARTWLEVAGIDSGRYKESVDPNLEALIRPLEDFKVAYPSFYEKPPNYFARPFRAPDLRSNYLANKNSSAA